MLTKHRFIKEDNSMYTETIEFTEDDNGFTMSGEDGTWKIVSIVSPAFDYTTIPTTDPYQITVRPSVQILTPQEYSDEKESRRTTRQQEIDSAKAEADSLPKPGIEFTDAEKEFLIDYYGKSYQIIPTKKQWFNIVYRFDPVDDDPRNTG